jgi:hypothetical protein
MKVCFVLLQQEEVNQCTENTTCAVDSMHTKINFIDWVRVWTGCGGI